MAKDTFSKRKELLTQKMSVDVKKQIVKTVVWSVECGAVWCGDVDIEERGYQAAECTRDVAKEKNGEGKLQR